MDQKLQMLLTLYRAYIIYKRYRGYYECASTGFNLLLGAYAMANKLVRKKPKKPELTDKELLESYVIIENI